MKKTLMGALAAAACIAPAALAVPAPHGAPPAPHSAHHPAVAYVMRGVVTATDSGALTITFDVSGGNHHARVALAGSTSFTALTDASTRFSKAGKGAATFADVQANDRVVVMLRAPRHASATDLAGIAARRVVDRGPKPQAS